MHLNEDDSHLGQSHICPSIASINKKQPITANKLSYLRALSLKTAIHWEWAQLHKRGFFSFSTDSGLFLTGVHV